MNTAALFRVLTGVLALWPFPSAASGSAPLALEPGQDSPSVSEYIQFVRDPTGSLPLSAVMRGEAGSFRRLASKTIDFGFTSDTIWLRLPVVNRGDRPGTWVLASDQNFMHWLEGYLVGEETSRLIMKDSEETPFTERRIPYRHLTAKFTLAAGEQASIVIGYRSEGASALPLTVESEAGFSERRLFEAIKNTVFYTAAGAMVLFSLVFMPVAHRRLQLAYAVYLTWVAVYVAQMDGYAFQVFWPDLPRWNAFASLPLGYGMAAFAALFAREFLKTPTLDRRLDRILLGIVWTSAALILLALVVGEQWLKKFGFVYICAVSVVLFGCGLAGLRYGRPGVRFFILGWLGIIAGAAFATVAHWKPGQLPVNASFEFIRAGMLLQGFLLALAIAEQLRRFRLERDAATRREIETMEQNVALERSHAYAQALADARRAQLSDASHDLKQPLLSLRLMLRRAMGPQDEAAVTAMRRSIDYLESLVRRYLDESRAPSELSLQPRGRDAEAGEIFEVGVILDNVVAMFAEEASAKGGVLRFAGSSARVRGDPMAVMRIVSNFVSNGIKHSTDGRVLVGCRRQEDRLRIEVHDVGRGLNEDRLKQLKTAYETGACNAISPDDGRGHKVALQLIIENGYGFDVRQRKGRGMVFALILPLAEARGRNMPAINPVPTQVRSSTGKRGS